MQKEHYKASISYISNNKEDIVKCESKVDNLTTV